ncbi:putative protein ABIL5 [Dichanthelium oligosanthes]|uniref:Protein ABIL5 n=1 Tax=Dichanthelium oligosanthes TaxID=888268 RepID=A0A1E5VBQ1_9POAL|nr:putative protein ABIL5 [Dichanthelium oligosanthes]
MNTSCLKTNKTLHTRIQPAPPPGTCCAIVVKPGQRERRIATCCPTAILLKRSSRGECVGRGEMDAKAGEAGMQPPGAASTSGAAVPFGRSSSRIGAPGAESFDGALRELKDLRSQLHEAADCCEKAFRNTEKKKLILEGTKSYICDAVVAVIDHLGTVSSNLEHKLQEKTDVTQIERKINFLKQLFEGPKRKMVLPLEITGSSLSGATTLKPYDVQPAIGKEHTMASASFDDSPRTLRRSFSFRAENQINQMLLKLCTDFVTIYLDQKKMIFICTSFQDVHIILGDHKKKANQGSNILSFLKKTRRQS